MHQIAQLLELPGNVGASCPSPPSINLHSLRKEAAAQSELFPAPLKKKKNPPFRRIVFSRNLYFVDLLFADFFGRIFFPDFFFRGKSVRSFRFPHMCSATC